jgi:hypothetical protein
MSIVDELRMKASMALHEQMMSSGVVNICVLAHSKDNAPSGSFIFTVFLVFDDGKIKKGSLYGCLSSPPDYAEILDHYEQDLTPVQIDKVFSDCETPFFLKLA